MIRRAAGALALLAVVALLPALPVRAQTEDPLDERKGRLGEPAGRPLGGEELDRRTAEVGALVRCPVCQGLSIADSPTVTAQAMMGEIRELLAQGYTQDQIFRYFEESYGEFIRLQPKAEGFNLLVWVAPVAALLLGLVLVAWRLRSRRAPAAVPAETDPDPELDPYLERVRREVEG